MPNKEPSQAREDKDSNSIGAVTTGKSLRADARRNRDRVLDIAAKVFATEGLDVPIDVIASRAGIGIGTVYRHFPTKEELIEAVVFSFKQCLIEKAREMLLQDDPGLAFFDFLSLIVRESMGNKAIIATLARAGEGIHRPLSGNAMDFQHALGELLKRAQQAGSVRNDIQVADISAILFGVMRTLESNADPGLSERILSVVCDGLRGR
ncbi:MULTISPECIES: TetR/AcrR family transcriptional regulator [Paenibacillus]|uniref:Transcriptional regulatory protein TetR n=1 Tax=Paenibacillus albilobatus TaxID=2716884 RepID=A0A920CAW2_9BACL|nr:MULTISPECIES: TetR/AcrR family transcriptional regulator [Paenibacillus]GIO31333.1 putative transcriptional regulatory protein TetR [Paenibacillus albilobatus]